ncbi:uncharacterized protein PHACADRAFT_138020 [Phanerochaete carnosa HHB-10118-sp]|uniref:Cytochrome P450 n=1 Tax=Phanerochaete carnosa (strain HHB-10118-sp) TaxID=650164 RepID=K5WKX4_PHACS|nr:uncharacterized protein PHACADRAFT_138020 [Phanerochaete carnosa HHB-10118-sp]EKM59789.1 hypothetical protein PHACADRAFT_138020 [Phanerochaete carnosa HHB-10118-sp]
MTYPLLAYAVGALVAFALYKLVRFIWNINTSPLRHLPGPPNDSLFWGNMRTIEKEEHSVVQERWAEQYGHSIAYKGVFGAWRLWTVDTRALNHVMTHSTIYQRPPHARYFLSRLVGPGILVAEGAYPLKLSFL